MADPGTVSVCIYKDLRGTPAAPHGPGVAGADRLMVLRIRITTILRVTSERPPDPRLPLAAPGHGSAEHRGVDQGPTHTRTRTRSSSKGISGPEPKITG